MNNTEDNIFSLLHSEGLIGDESFERVESKRLNPLLSVHWEINTLLYLGVILITTGLGVLVYKNIDTIGHQVILLVIALISGGSFAYCYKNKKPFSNLKVQTPSTFYDYILLLSAITFLIFTGYLQYEYQVFGTHYGMATFIPMLVLFYMAYAFDHVGILNLAITNLGVWLGVSVTPKQLLLYADFDNQTLIYTYLGFGCLLLAAAWLTGAKHFKKHFKFSYAHYGLHISMVALLAGYFYSYKSSASVMWLLGLFCLAAVIYKDAYKDRNFYFLVLVILYSYVAFSCLVVRLLITINDEGAFYLLLMYFIASATGLIYFLANLNRKLKSA